MTPLILRAKDSTSCVDKPASLWQTCQLLNIVILMLGYIFSNFKSYYKWNIYSALNNTCIYRYLDSDWKL